jgi:hypothetical protein
MTKVGEHGVTRTRRKQNGSGSIKAERNRIIAFLRYALDDVGAVSERGAHYLQLAIETLEDEARKEPAVLGAHDAGGT